MSARDSLDDFGLPPGTRIESVEAIRRAQQERVATRLENAPALPEAVPFRPSLRPPLGLLCVFDDGSDDGEWFRLRRTPFVIGRTGGDVIVPHDDQISGRHLEITRRQASTGWRWMLTDLGSTNGTFVRATTIRLKDGQEMLLGGKRYRFDANPPSLVELLADRDGPRYPLDRPDLSLGRDPSRCSLRLDDPMLDPVHARLQRTAEGWELTAQGTVNGAWLRIAKASIGGACHFQLGEQRFLLRSC